MIINFTNSDSTLNTRRVQDSDYSITDGIASAIRDAVNDCVDGAVYDFNEFARIARELNESWPSDGYRSSFIMDNNILKGVVVYVGFEENENGEVIANLVIDID